MDIKTTRKIDKLFRSWDKPDTPGFSIAVIHHGKIEYSRCYGMASLEHRAQISDKTVFDIGSTSKQFVAFCIALLENRKKLSLDDEVHKFIPELTSYRYPVTLRHLLFHTSGIRDYLALMELAGMRYENEYPDEEILGLIFKQKELNFKPGGEFLYSNSGYLLLGEVIKRVSGQSLREFSAKNIFLPLGMRNTHFNDDFTQVIRNKATGYSVVDGDIKVNISLFDAVGDGGVNTTVGDLALWDENFYRNILGGGGELIKKITTPGILNNGRFLDYAYGLFVTEYRGQKLISHGGAWVGYRAELLRFPKKMFSVVCLSNMAQAKPTSLAKQITDICLENELSGAMTPSATSAAIKNTAPRSSWIKTGFYSNSVSGKFLEISRKDNKQFLRDEEFTYELFPAGNNRFVIASGSRELTIMDSGLPATSIVLKKLNGPTLTYEKMQPKSFRQVPLPKLCGEYYSAELGVVWRLSVRSKKLFLERKGLPKEELRPVRRGIFAGDYLYIEFHSAANRLRKQFFLNAGRVRNILFCMQPLRSLRHKELGF